MFRTSILGSNEMFGGSFDGSFEIPFDHLSRLVVYLPFIGLFTYQVQDFWSINSSELGDSIGDIRWLGGGFKHFLFSPLPGEMIQFD